MKLRVRERGDEVHVEVDGVAGRQQRVLEALTECRRRAGGECRLQSGMSDVAIRAGTDSMRIRFKGRAGLSFEAAVVYQCLREALVERQADADGGVRAPSHS